MNIQDALSSGSRSTPAGLTLWQPEIVLAPSVSLPDARPAVTIPAPRLRPLAVRSQIEAVRSLLTSLAEAREVLGARVESAFRRVEAANSTREQVSAAMETYQVEAALDDVLTGTLRQVTALLEERGLR
jgi:hypothetical protein